MLNLFAALPLFFIFVQDQPRDYSYTLWEPYYPVQMDSVANMVTGLWPLINQVYAYDMIQNSSGIYYENTIDLYNYHARLIIANNPMYPETASDIPIRIKYFGDQRCIGEINSNTRLIKKFDFE